MAVHFPACSITVSVSASLFVGERSNRRSLGSPCPFTLLISQADVYMVDSSVGRRFVREEVRFLSQL